MTLRSLLATAAGTLACIGAANAATITTDSRTVGPAQVLTATVSGVDVSATAATWTYGTWDRAARTGTGGVDRLGPNDRATIQAWAGHGLGLRNDPHGDSDHRIDGRGTLDLVILEFGRDVTLSSLGFSYVDGNDDFVLFVGDTLGELSAYTALDVAELVDFGGMSLALTGRFFGIGALGRNDEFKLTAIDFDVAPVPVPGAALLLLTGLGGAAWARKRSA